MQTAKTNTLCRLDVAEEIGLLPMLTETMAEVAAHLEANQGGKVCTKCGEYKEFSRYYRDARARDGLHSSCRDCHRLITKAYSTAHPEIVMASTARYRDRIRGTEKEQRAKEVWALWAAKNRVKMREKQKRYARAHPEKIRSRVVVSSAKRKAAKLRAIPKWADLAEIVSIYNEARAISKETGVVHHVDHIVPLISKTVCGLHVPANLRITSGIENMSKSNRYWPDMP